jgi:outer membrane protein insertion porin family
MRGPENVAGIEAERELGHSSPRVPAGPRRGPRVRDPGHNPRRDVYERRARRYAFGMRRSALSSLDGRPAPGPSVGSTRRARLVGGALLVLAVMALAAPRAFALGEEITDVRVLGNSRTDEGTVRSIAGVSLGDTLEMDTLDRVRERLNTSGLFADVNVWWEQHGAGVRVNIAVKDKFPWAPVPTASWSANNKAIGLVFVHGNLFGRGKQLLLGARLATVDSGVVVAYRDPSLFGSWIYWQLQGQFQRQDIPEYEPDDAPGLHGPFRDTLLHSLGFEPTLGVAWFRRLKTQVAWRLESFTVEKSYLPADDSQTPLPTMEQASQSARVGIGKFSMQFDFRAREFAVMTGTIFGGGIDIANPTFKSQLTFWRAGGGFEHGARFFRSHNLIMGAGATFGHNLPFWMENSAGGPNLRGFLYQQFRGDSQISAKLEYHFPLFSIGSLDFRALGFYDMSAIWFRELPVAGTGFDPTAPPDQPAGYVVRDTRDARSFYEAQAGVKQGFDFSRDIHQDVGGGLRFFLRSVAVPLVGFDAGYGLDAHRWRFLLIIGA